MFRLFCTIMVFVWFSGPALAAWPIESHNIGQRDHPKIMARFGGEIPAGDLTDYVNGIGQNLVLHSSHPDKNWTFTILDSPDVNAFALPGGFVYVTRGLLALANNEAELAAVLAHEITHVVENHVETREADKQDALIDGALGALTQGLFGGGGMGNAIRDNMQDALKDIGANSQEQEYAADRGGIILLAKAGYDPTAQADFLAAMVANSALRATMAGSGYDPEKVPFFANHPAPLDREIVARELAQGLDGFTNQEAYFKAIDTLLFGDNARQGFVRGQVYSHPELGFTFRAANGLNIQNTPRQINIFGGRGATLIMTGAPDPGGELSDYVAGWANSLPRRNRIGRRGGTLTKITINGLESATLRISYRNGARRGDMQLTVIRFNGGLIRFAGFSLSRDDRNQEALNETVRSFSRLSSSENARQQEYHIEIHTVEHGDTIATLSANFPQLEFAQDLFRVLNDITETGELTTGDLVKIIVETPQ